MTTPEGTLQGFCRLDSLAAIRVSGTAARNFLSRQLTCDVAILTPDNPLFGAWLTPKGRALCLMHVLDSADGVIHMLVPDELADDVVKRLAMFVLRDDVRLTRDPSRVVLGLSGDGVIRAMGGDSPLVPLSQGAPPLALALVDSSSVPGLIGSLEAEGHAALTESTWDRLRIRAGLPWVVEATRDAFVPQMMNLDLLGAVSFTKGCYPGQEIVARTQHLGRIKRRTFIGHSEQRSPHACPGDTLVPEGGNDAAGRVVLAAVHDDGQDVLAVISLDAMAATDTFRLNSPEGPRVRFVAPAYLDENS